MKREEKNQLTRRRILESALAEFAEKGYDAASMNNICMAGDVSKGIVYHYFTDKDELYLACIIECFSMLRQATSAIRLDEASGIAEGLAAYFEGREAFFSANPECYKLFCSATSNPPAHLQEQVKQARSNLDALSLQTLTWLISKEQLRPGIHIEDVAEEFRHYQDYFNLRARALTPEEREKACRLSLDILLYGVIKHDNT